MACRRLKLKSHGLLTICGKSPPCGRNISVRDNAMNLKQPERVNAQEYRAFA
jgi:hypothetical protein